MKHLQQRIKLCLPAAFKGSCLPAGWAGSCSGAALGMQRGADPPGAPLTSRRGVVRPWRFRFSSTQAGGSAMHPICLLQLPLLPERGQIRPSRPFGRGGGPGQNSLNWGKFDLF